MDKTSTDVVFASMVSKVLLILASTILQGVEGTIGVNYGTVANNLAPPAQVADFLLESTTINRVRLFDANPDILQAFAHTGIEVTITVPNDQIPHLTNLSFAQQWVKTNVESYIPATDLVRVLVGNEVVSTANKQLIASLVPAMQTLHSALAAASLERSIKVSTPHSLGILSSSSPPSTGKFRQGYDTHVLKPLLTFLRATNAPFMVNPYPFFGCSSETLDYALFRPNPGVLDENTRLLYTNMLDAQLDAVFSALKLLGFDDIEIVIAETGWPSEGDLSQVGVSPDSAADYNSNLVRHVMSGNGTPLMPNRTFETYVFALFNENLKPGPTCERNFGLFRPDMTPVYDAGILRPTVAAAADNHPKIFLLVIIMFVLDWFWTWLWQARSTIPTNRGPDTSPGPGIPPISSSSPLPREKGKQWCVPKAGADPDALQRNIDYVCGLGLSCGPIQEGGPCFLPNTVGAHASYSMNLFYQVMGRHDYDCDFDQTGSITVVDPSYGRCVY